MVVAEGPRRGLAWESSLDRCAIGAHPSNDIVIDDPTVSRFHCEVLLDDTGARVRDLDSRNGTTVDGLRVLEAWLRPGSIVRLGGAALQFQLGTDVIALPVSERRQFGSLVGQSAVMRTAFALLERVSASDATVLIEGETGTGKEGAAEAIHNSSARKDKPLVVVDCGSIPANLLESELFGHEKGAFTGAVATRIGAFEAAHGGTLFLDEIGELPLDLQPKILRALERREIKRVGENQQRVVDVRVIAATHRDLRRAVNQGAFRSDLYFRLAVLRVGLPPLRQRLEDLPLLVEQLLARLGATPEAAAPLRTQEFIDRLALGAWPGNVRELRNHLERCLVFQEALPLEDANAATPADTSAPPPDTGLYAEARRRALEAFEQRYLQAMLQKHQGKVAAAALEAGIDRVSMYRLLRKHKLGDR
ncbi:MAG: sigma 54-interacting transcriptional regulator [Deltaproteobacteria bacterium]|nr:sigma 54-interacting transcriptional regulator [Deltaproteobacteria bacterium]